VYVEDGDLGVVTRDGVMMMRDGKETTPREDKVTWNVEEAQKGGYEHYMLKEIHEQPRVIRSTIGEYARMEQPAVALTADGANGAEPLLFLACGTSYHAALVGRQVFEELAGIPVRVEVASEFVYSGRPPECRLAVAITQSGETADTLKAMKRVSEAGFRTVAITNVVGSTASRVASQTLYTRAGPEISVAATKSFTAQLIVLYLMAINGAGLTPKRLNEFNSELRLLPSKVQQLLDHENGIEQCAKYLKTRENAFFVARGLNLPVAMEGALKLKEISYIHAEGLSAGEMKHGPLALLCESTPVIAVFTRDNTYEAMLTNVKEIKARGAPVIAVAEEGDDAVNDLADTVIHVPAVAPLFSPVVNTVALQLLAYYTSRERGCPVDFPRNLAKSVTVE
jgi:glucosamine--fructose-6-phosphate aminotransferase (isomerizing)